MLSIKESIALEGQEYKKFMVFMGFELENDNVFDVVKKLGPAPIYEEGDAAFYNVGVCYHLKNKSGTVKFESGQLGGKYHYLLSFVLTKDLDKDHECGKLGVEIDDLSLGGIKIGKQYAKAYKLLPKPITIFSYGSYHERLNRIKAIDKSYGEVKTYICEESIFIQVLHENGIVKSVSSSKITAC